MKFNAEIYFQTSVNLLLGIAFLTLASTGRMDALSVAVFLIAYIFYSYSYLRRRAPLFSARQVSILTKLYLVIFAVDLLWWSRSFVDATLHLLVVIQVFKFFSEKKDRDYFYLILIAFMELLAAAAMTISAGFFLFFMLFLGIVIATLVSFEMKRTQGRMEGDLDHGPPPERRGKLFSKVREKKYAGWLASASALLCAGTMGVASMIFFALPRVAGGFFSRADTSTQAITGFSSTVHFGDVGSIKRNMALVMRVEIEGPVKDFAGVKWRGIALNTFDGSSWYRTLGRQSILLPRQREGSMEYYSPMLPEFPPPHRLVQYRVILEPLSTNVLFLAQHTRSIMTPAPVRMDSADSFFTDLHPYSRIRYEAFSDVAAPGPALPRRAAGAYPAEIVRYYLQMPAVDPRVVALAKKVTQSAMNNFDRAEELERYLKQNYRYTLDLPAVRESDPIAQFLFETRRGHCEYFASSMAVMLRVLGIPSRLVNGFQTGEYNAVGNDFIVRESDAHSWVEAYFQNYGWVPFDPTPSVAQPKPAAAWITLNHYLDAMELFWINWVIGYDSFRQFTLFQDLQHRVLELKRVAERTWLKIYSHTALALQNLFFSTPRRETHVWRGFGFRPKVTWNYLLWLVPVICVLIVFTWIQKKRARSFQPRRVSEMFSRWLRALARAGYHRPPAQTPLEFSGSIPDPRVRQLSVDLTQIYNSLRFNPSSSNAEAFRHYQEKLRAAIRSL